MRKLGVRPEMTILRQLPKSAQTSPIQPLFDKPYAPWHKAPNIREEVFSPHLPRDLRSDQLSNSRFTRTHPGLAELLQAGRRGASFVCLGGGGGGAPRVPAGSRASGFDIPSSCPDLWGRAGGAPSARLGAQIRGAAVG